MYFNLYGCKVYIFLINSNSNSVSLDTAACAQKPNESIYRAITQTPEGALSVYYKGKEKSSFQTWCAITSPQSRLETIIVLKTRCAHTRYISGQRYIFGMFFLIKHCVCQDFVAASIFC
jgi:hypothetical protein